ncbi:hypothetical protein BS78_05G208900 [Paspalum vaginatum]|nr:hypothetical protein BS78_05G208900 [Paspalum vaginatum]
MFRQDPIDDWLEGNPNNQEGSSSSSNAQDLHPHVLMGAARPRSEPQFAEFDELRVFENPNADQTPEVNMHHLMCRLHSANDRESLGKQIGGESKQANLLLQDAAEMTKEIKESSGL